MLHDRAAAENLHGRLVEPYQQARLTAGRRHAIHAIDTANADRVVMYSGFERTRIRSLEEDLPELAGPLDELEHKMLDLLPVIRNNVYHPDFLGSFSIKYVLNPLVPDLDYDDLVIVDGLRASVEIARLLFMADRIPPEERDRLRWDLLEYCERDTWAMVKLLERLRELAAA